MQLTDRTILITGGTSGIGFELAKLLLARGNTVLITGRDPGRLAAAERALPGVHAFASDVSDPAAIAALRERVLAEFPALDVLVNNAGIMRNLDFARAGASAGTRTGPRAGAPTGGSPPGGSPPGGSPPGGSPPGGLDDVAREVDVDLSGPVRMVEQFLPHLQTRERALLVNVTSGLAFVPFPPSPVYSAAKAGLHAFTRALRVQLAGTGVRVVELAPPAVETALLRGEFEAATRGPKPMPPAALAARAVAGIEAGKLEIRPGLSNVLKLMSRVAPQFMLRQMARMSAPKPVAGPVRAAAV